MQERKVPVDDLHALLAQPMEPVTTGDLIGSDGVHLTPAAQELAGQQVSAFLRQQLTGLQQP
ncbi:MAG: hypothetical protein RIK87_15405 [Fuerstiella sp.]